MILEKLLLVEFATERKIRKEYSRLEAVHSILELLDQIDFDVEEVPVEDTTRLVRLLTSLKGSSLSEEELKVVAEITANEKNHIHLHINNN